jgi:hypothetical protein
VGFEEYAVPGSVIPGFFEPALLEQPLVRIAIRISGRGREWVPVTMILDTGASATCVHASTAIDLLGMAEGELDSSSWPTVHRITGIGGTRAYFTVDAQFGFPRLDGSLEVLAGTLQVGELSSRGIPPILGWDLLRQFQLFIDGPGGSIELRRPPSSD